MHGEKKLTQNLHDCTSKTYLPINMVVAKKLKAKEWKKNIVIDGRKNVKSRNVHT